MARAKAIQKPVQTQAPHAAKLRDETPTWVCGLSTEEAAAALSALAHPGRLEIFRLLVKAGHEGRAAGDVARETGSLANTLSANLSILHHAGLVSYHRAGRSIIYAANYERVRALIGFLMEDCCGGRKEICEPLIAVARRACC